MDSEYLWLGICGDVTDRDLETTRVVYGFWPIIASLLLTLAVVTLTINMLRTEATANEAQPPSSTSSAARSSSSSSS